MNNRTLLIIFVALLGIYGLTQVFSSKKERSFKTELIQVDTAQVTSILLKPKVENGEEITLKKEGKEWLVTKGNKTSKAVKNVVDALLNDMVLVKTKRVAAKRAEKWKDYEVDEETGTKVKVYSGNEVIEEFIVGRINFKQGPQGQPTMGGQPNISATTFVRLDGEDEVYAVDGFLAMTFNRDFAAFRNKELIKMQAGQTITAFEYEGENPMRFSKKETDWVLNESITLDSVKVDRYLNTLRNISATDFADDFDDSNKNDLLYRKLNLKGDNMSNIEVKVYYNGNQEKPFIIHSTYNPEAYFASDSSGVYQRLFKSIEDFQ